MHKCKTTAKVNLFGGRIGLTEAQARRRPAGLLKDIGGGVYEIMGHVTLKAGEIILLDYVPKALRKYIDDLTEIEEADAAKIKADAEEEDEKTLAEQKRAAAIKADAEEPEKKYSRKKKADK